MKNKQTILLLSGVIALLLALVAGGGMAWWRMQHPAKDKVGSHEAAASKEEVESEPHHSGKGPYKYVSLDKVIVMLRGKADEPASAQHYLAMDIVFKVDHEQEKTLKDHLPLLRSIAVKALSSYPLDKANVMTIDQYTTGINTAFNDSYKRDKSEKPFVEAMVGKLIIE